MNYFVITVIWLSLGVIGHGLRRAYFVRKYSGLNEPRTIDDVIFVILGPITLITSISFLYMKNKGYIFKYGFII